ncbi:MAG: stage sporulation protein D-like protein [Fibrobacteres bacterium]|nr:stage sporulation protein D-like protein [Fibrobacterota bacterium]
MKRTGPTRPTAGIPASLLLLSSFLLLTACTAGPFSHRAASPAKDGTAAKADTARAAPAFTGDKPFPDSSITASPSFADSTDSLGDAGFDPDSNRTAKDSVAKPSPAALANGIAQRPRPKNLPDRVHVFLSRSPKPLVFYSLGDVQILGERTDTSGSGKPPKSERLTTLRGRFTLRRSGAGYAIEQPNKAALPASSRKLRLISVNPYNLLEVGGMVYRGGMHIIGEGNGDITAVNVLGVEDYLRGVLPYELGKVDRDALEALKAQAIVARTYAYKRMMRASASDFHLYNDVQDQVYKGVRGEYLLSDRAVWETRGMAVTHSDTLAICYYFSTCGGRTANKSEVWGGEITPYLISRPDTDDVGDAYCQASKYSEWTEEWTVPQLAGILRRNLRSAGVADAPSFASVKGIEVTQRAACGRVRLMRIDTDRGPILVKGDKVRWALRPAATEAKILPSAFFSVKMSGGKVTATGKAFGHGVGLCQVGAIGRARDHQTFRQIIEAYYQGVQIVEFK